MATQLSVEKLQFKRRTSAQLDAIVLDVGEPAYATDTNQVKVGDGATPGGRLIGPADHDIVYGVRWAHTLTSPTLTKGILVNGQFVPNAYTSGPIQDMMARVVVDNSLKELYELDPADSILKKKTTASITGTTNAAEAYKLKDSTQTFQTQGVVAGVWVKNTTRNLRAMVTSVIGEGELGLSHDIFTLGEGYAIGTANPKADGCVVVRIQAFHYIWLVDGNYTYLLVSRSPFVFRRPSNGAVVASALHPWFMEGGSFKPFKYYSAFESVWYDISDVAYKDHDGAIVCASDDKAVSLPGYKPLTYQYRGNTTPNFRQLHTNFGASFNNQGFFACEALWILMVTEWGTLNGQVALPGYTNASAWSYAYTRKTGRTMGLGNASGSVMVDLTGLDSDLSGILGSGNAVANSFHGVENPFGHIWKWVDGANFNWVSNGGKVYLSNNPSSWAEDTATGYQDTGLLLPAANGYISALFEGRLLPSSVTGGGSSYYLCDYFYQPGASAGWRGLVVGGGLHGGAAAGPTSLSANHSGSGARYASVGGRAAA